MNFKFAIAASTAMTLAGIFSPIGCGGDVCTKAGDQFASCGIMSTPTTSAVPPCTGSTLCLANCANNATCPQLKDAASGMPTMVSKPYTDCTEACLTAK